jgi:hypothetical protein
MRFNLVGTLYLELGHLLSHTFQVQVHDHPAAAIAEMTDGLPVLSAARRMTNTGGPAALPMTAKRQALTGVNDKCLQIVQRDDFSAHPPMTERLDRRLPMTDDRVKGR